MRRLGPVLLVLASLPPLAAQTTWHVDVAGVFPGTGSPADPYTSIQYALAQPTTLEGDTLLVAPGVYLENLLIDKRVIIASSGGPDVTSVLAALPQTLVRVTANDAFNPQATLRGFTLDGSAFPTGTGIHVQNGGSSSLRLERSVVREFSAGRAIWLHANSYVDAYQSTIARNDVGVQIATAVSNGVLTLVGSVLRDNVKPLVGDAQAGLNPHYSCLPENLAALFPASGNIPDAPGFWNAAAGDLHLAPGSPCIDAVARFVPPDPDGSLGDMGAHTYDKGYAWGPITYCTAKTDSAGCAPSVSAVGQASASGVTGLVVSAAGVLGQKTGLAFYGALPGSGPLLGGTLCVAPPLTRVAPQGSGGTSPDDCSGSLSFDVGAWLAAGQDPALQPGALMHVQFWYRDPDDPLGYGSGLSNAAGFGVAP